MSDQDTIKQPTAVTADDVFLDAKARFDAWLENFQAEWYKPQVETAAKLLWKQQPDDVKEQVRTNQPAAAKKMDDLLKRKEG
jgi:hypothetical protein